MAVEQFEIHIGLRWRWWVWPLIRGAAIWYRCGLPVDPHKLGEWIGRHGAIMVVE